MEKKSKLWREESHRESRRHPRRACLARQSHTRKSRLVSGRARPPTIPMAEARRDIQSLFHLLEKAHPAWGLEFETYVSVPGARISEEHEMIRAIDRNHNRITGKTPEREVVTWCSDASVLSRYGVETVNYGPSSGPRDKEGEKVRIQTLVDITKIYALHPPPSCAA